MNDLLFIGIDPGIYSTSIAILDAKSNLIKINKLYERKEDEPRQKRLLNDSKRKTDPVYEQIAFDHYHFMYKIIDNFQPQAIAIESMIWSSGYGNSNTEAQVGHFRGIMHAVAIKLEIPFYLVAPTQIKKIVTDNGNADKNKVCEYIWDRYKNDLIKYCIPNISKLKKENHIADAIGAAMFLVSQEMSYLDSNIEDRILEEL